MRSLPAVVVACVAVACGSSSSVPAGSVGGGPDGGSTADAGSGGTDAGTTDGGSGGGPDAGSADGGTVSGVPVPLTAGESAVALALDDANVYWMGKYGSPVPNNPPDPSVRYALRGMSKSGVAPIITYFEAPGRSVGSPVADGAHVYWLSHGCTSVPCENPPIDLRRVARAGGPAETVAGKLSFNAVEIDLDPSFVYVGKTGAHDFAQGSITRLPKAGGSEETIILGDNVQDIAVLLDGLYWTTTDGLRKRAPDGNVVTLASIPRGAGRFKVDGGNVFLRAYSGDLMVAPRGGGNATALWHSSSLSDLDANAGVVYWVQDATGDFTGCLGRANADGRNARCLDTAGTTYRAIRVDDTAVFFIRDGNVYRMGK